MRQLDSILKKTKPLFWSEDFRLKCLNTSKWPKMTQKIPRNRFSEPRSHEARDISSADNAFFFPDWNKPHAKISTLGSKCTTCL